MAFTVLFMLHLGNFIVDFFPEKFNTEIFLIPSDSNSNEADYLHMLGFCQQIILFFVVKIFMPTTFLLSLTIKGL